MKRKPKSPAGEHQRVAVRKETRLRAAVITASDTRTRGDDLSGNLLAAGLAAAGVAVIDRRIVHDEVSALSAAIAGALAAGADVVVITGGTGVAPRDVTPEALAALGARPLPGFGETFRALSFARVGPAALLSRATAGTLGRAVVYALPGSPDACELALTQLILPGLHHLLHHLSGRAAGARGGSKAL
jgi:molybdenum cofactor biosynthesis protein B